MRKGETEAPPLTETMQTRMSAAQAAEVRAAAHMAGMQVSTFLRVAALREARRGDG